MNIEPRQIEVRYYDLTDIKPYWKNPRINDDTINALVEVIPIIGFNQPIVIDKNNVIVKGHARYTAAMRLKMDKIPCIVSENTEEINKLDRIADNKVFELSTWDEKVEPLDIQPIQHSGQLRDVKYTVVCPYCGDVIEVIV